MEQWKNNEDNRIFGIFFLQFVTCIKTKIVCKFQVYIISGSDFMDVLIFEILAARNLL